MNILSKLYYAVEIKHHSGTFVLCKTQSREVADDVAAHVVADGDEVRVYPYTSRLDGRVWLGFPFAENGVEEIPFDILSLPENRTKK